MMIVVPRVLVLYLSFLQSSPDDTSDTCPTKHEAAECLRKHATAEPDLSPRPSPAFTVFTSAATASEVLVWMASRKYKVEQG